jgi:hypothetical protein
MKDFTDQQDSRRWQLSDRLGRFFCLFEKKLDIASWSLGDGVAGKSAASSEIGKYPPLRN